MHLSRWIIVWSAASATATLALPFLEAPLIGPVRGVAATMWPALLFLLPAVILAVVGDHAEGFGPLTAVVALVAAAVATLFAVSKVVDASAAAADARVAAGSGSVGLGAWVLLAATVGVMAGAVVSLSRRVR